MCEETNHSQVIQIHLLGFQDIYKFRILFFIAILVCYIIIFSGNLLIIILVTTVDRLKIPMFFFLKHLATADALVTTTIVPLILDIVLREEGTLPLAGCIAQTYFVFLFGYAQCMLIPIMSYDRYLAICAPLRYNSLMNLHVCLQLVSGSWCLGALLISSEIIVVCHFNFCGLNVIDHFFCDFGPVVHLSTSDSSSLLIYDSVISIVMVTVPLAFIIITYIYISVTIMKISSAHGRRKAFSTCSSHLATVCSYYGSLINVYVVPSDYSTISMNKYRSLLYIVLTPLMNPIVYSLRNKEIKRTLLKLFWNNRADNKNI